MPASLAALNKVSDVKADEVDAHAEQLAKLTAEQERLARFGAFTIDDAWEVGTTIRDTFLESYADGGRAGIVINIETFAGFRLFSAAVGNSAAIGPENW